MVMDGTDSAVVRAVQRNHSPLALTQHTPAATLACV
jgi:hypothetical protein